VDNLEIKELMLENVMGDRFGRYSKYIIQDRALPDIRDGLKPVQRRILYAMDVAGNTSDKGFRKSAKTVGNVIGNYHPHGDSSVYEAMVRLSQDWKMREVLVEMHGNNGSMDGDSAAAMRYTEARLSKISAELLRDIDKETVDFVLNFDDTDQEPTVLPARYPNLLVNGATGISAGYATDIPPHNLGEVIDATLHLIDHPEAELKALMKYVKGPDFPTGAIIQGLDGLKDAYNTGKGKVVVRSRTSIESIRGGKQQIVISEIPYDVNKATLVKRMDEIRINRKIEGIAEVRDESDRSGLQIVVELKKEANAEGILNYLLKNTDLQVNYNFNMVAIDERRPKQVGLHQILKAYIRHQKIVITRRTNYSLKKAETRLHIVDALIRVISILDEVIQLIRDSKDKKDSKQNLMKQYSFSETQSEAIVSLQLYRLSNTDITALQNEKLELNEQIATYKEILKQEKTLYAVMKTELASVKKQYANARRSTIQHEIEEIKIDTEVLVPVEEVVVVITKEGYYKRTSLRSFGASTIAEIGLREGDKPLFVGKASTLDAIVMFTNKGDYLHFPIHELPELKWKDTGHHISQNIPFAPEEKIINVEILPNNNEPTGTILFVSKEGYIKQTLMSDFRTFRGYRNKKAVAMKLKSETDAIVSIQRLEDKQNYDVLLVTHFGFSLRYAVNEVGIIGTRASGVKSINLKDGDIVVGGAAFKEGDEDFPILVVTQRGNIKKFKSGEVPILGRAKRGLMLLKELKAKPHRIIFMDSYLSLPNRYAIRTTVGNSVVVESKETPFSPRYSNGSFAINEKTDGEVSDIEKEFDFSQIRIF
jgi:topoisomerase-4 subunit A